MTISTSQNQILIAGNGIQTSFQFNFVGDSSSVIAVYTINSSNVITQLLPSQYTLTLTAAQPNQLWGIGGTVLYPLVGSPLPTGSYLLIQRVLPLTQQVSIQNQGNVYPQVTEQALDILEMQIQQLSTRTTQFRGTWITNTFYNFGDIVQDGINGNNTGNYYICQNANTSGVWSTDLANGDWTISVTAVVPSLPLPLSQANGGTGATSLTNLITNSYTAQVPSYTLKGNNTGSMANLKDLTVDQVLTMLGITSITPQGRLTLSGTSAVMVADITSLPAIYYLPYNGQIIPIYDGTDFVFYTIPSSLTLGLNSTNHPINQVFDVYASIQSGVVTLSAMYWGGNTSRSSSAGGKTGSGNATIVQKSGLWVNNAAISSNDSFNGSTGYAIPQFQGIYLGSFYTTGNGQTGIALTPSSASAGSANIVGLYNAYNRIKANSYCLDNTVSWTYSVSTWRPSNNSSNNSVHWIDGLQQTLVEGEYVVPAANSAGAGTSAVGINFNSVTSTPTVISYLQSGINGFGNLQTVKQAFYPQFGYNYIQAMENTGTGIVTYLGNTREYLVWRGEI